MSEVSSVSLQPQKTATDLDAGDWFWFRHIGTRPEQIREMLGKLGFDSLEALSAATVPAKIRRKKDMDLGWANEPTTEAALLTKLRSIANENQVFRSMLGMGYYDTITPPVILRNILENPGWYTQYTPYQAEISQGRLELLLNFQTMIADLTGLPLAGASLLDEGTAAAEAMAMAVAIVDTADRRAFLIDERCHPQTIEVVRTRAEALGVAIEIARVDAEPNFGKFAGVLIPYPATCGSVFDWTDTIAKIHQEQAIAVMVTDPLFLTLYRSPGEMGADIAVGSAQRFGVPMGFGGPHAAFIATKNEHVRKLPGRIIGVSKDVHGNIAYRMAIQTREQHIRREKATSNICTAQALLAIIAGLYGAYHGPEGLRAIAKRVRTYATWLKSELEKAGHSVLTSGPLFDTVRVKPLGNGKAQSAILAKAHASRINLRSFSDGTFGISCDETTTRNDIENVLAAFDAKATQASFAYPALPGTLARTSSFMTHPVFSRYHSETEMLRYISKLQSRDLSLAYGMIPLGSCTMKLNATSEMIPVTWPEFGALHPFAPAEQTRGYQKIFADLEQWLSSITGFAACSLQPNAGSQGEFAGLLVIRAYHQHRGETQRNVCLIPESAHGTNPASAVVAGMKVVGVKCDKEGNVELGDLRAKAEAHKDVLAALMITYPSTHGVFEEPIREICEIVHGFGGQVYMDGANMNAQVGLTSPGDIGADVCHLNLHKTFCIPHGGGGPGMGPICVAAHLAPFLPGHSVRKPASAGDAAVGAISAAPYGSASILLISWMYIALMGARGLTLATQAAILHANYMAKRLERHYPVLFTGPNGRVAHEFILDIRPLEQGSGIKNEDIAKRLMDYGFHAPTMSFPVPGTLMIEPTESEPLYEMDRFCDAMIQIRDEIAAVESGAMPKADNVLKHAPHTQLTIAASEWTHPYSREQAAFPTAHQRDWKFWPHVGRVDNPYGDRNLICSCVSVEEASS